MKESFLKEKYIQDGLSSQEIAKITFSSRSSVTNHLIRHGIPLKSVTRRVNGSHVFGFRKHRGRSVESKKEHDVLILIQDYRSRGYSYQKIANILNDQNIATKNRLGCWYSKVVRQIYLRNI